MKKIRALARSSYERSIINGALRDMVKDRKSLQKMRSNEWAQFVGSERRNVSLRKIYSSFLSNIDILRDVCGEYDPFVNVSAHNEVPGVKKKTIRKNKKDSRAL